MSRNVTILVIILVIILIAGYLLWLRGRFQTQPLETTTVVGETVTPTLIPTIASPSAMATPTAGVSTGSGRVVR